jgi:hypothetical protein
VRKSNEMGIQKAEVLSVSGIKTLKKEGYK